MDALFIIILIVVGIGLTALTGGFDDNVDSRGGSPGIMEDDTIDLMILGIIK